MKTIKPPKKPCIALETNPCFGERTGIGMYTYELIKQLVTAYPKFEYIAQIYDNCIRSLPKPYFDFPVNVDKCTLFPYGVYRRIWKYLPLPYDFLFRKKAHIYHFFNFIVPPKVQGRVITTIHDITYLLYPETMDVKNCRRLRHDMEYSVSRSDIVITISLFTKKMLIEQVKVPEKKIRIITPGVDFKQFSIPVLPETMDFVRKKYDLPHEYVLFMGTLEPRKNIETILKAYKVFLDKSRGNLSRIKLVIAGKKGWLFEKIFELAKTLSLEESVIFTGYVDAVDKSAIYQGASLFLFPSIYEGFGIPVIEAMSAGVPVITSNNSSLPEVGGSAAIQVDCMDYERIAHEMQYVLANHDIATGMVVRGRQHALQFSWEKSASELTKVYSELLS